ncbi:hypothetical protein BJ742DRAFT_787530 [Cladochytrium replicatum]|nr:hypothetical protein BJ742DRAFT_787530 [Cladochytrium replicatum]
MEVLNLPSDGLPKLYDCVEHPLEPEKFSDYASKCPNHTSQVVLHSSISAAFPSAIPHHLHKSLHPKRLALSKCQQLLATLTPLDSSGSVSISIRSRSSGFASAVAETVLVGSGSQQAQGGRICEDLDPRWCVCAWGDKGGKLLAVANAKGHVGIVGADGRVVAPFGGQRRLRSHLVGSYPDSDGSAGEVPYVGLQLLEDERVVTGIRVDGLIDVWKIEGDSWTDQGGWNMSRNAAVGRVIPGFVCASAGSVVFGGFGAAVWKLVDGERIEMTATQSNINLVNSADGIDNTIITSSVDASVALWSINSMQVAVTRSFPPSVVRGWLDAQGRLLEVHFWGDHPSCIVLCFEDVVGLIRIPEGDSAEVGWICKVEGERNGWNEVTCAGKEVAIILSENVAPKNEGRPSVSGLFQSISNALTEGSALLALVKAPEKHLPPESVLRTLTMVSPVQLARRKILAFDLDAAKSTCVSYKLDFQSLLREIWSELIEASDSILLANLLTDRHADWAAAVLKELSESQPAWVVQSILETILPEPNVMRRCLDVAIDVTAEHVSLNNVLAEIQRLEEAIAEVIENRSARVSRANTGDGSVEESTISKSIPASVPVEADDPQKWSLDRLKLFWLSDRLETFCAMNRLSTTLPAQDKLENFSDSFRKFLRTRMVVIAAECASRGDVRGLSVLFSRHSRILLKHRFVILSFLPEWQDPSAYWELIPRVDPGDGSDDDGGGREGRWRSIPWRRKGDWCETEDAKAFAGWSEEDEDWGGQITDVSDSTSLMLVESEEYPTTQKKVLSWIMERVEQVERYGLIDHAVALLNLATNDPNYLALPQGVSKSCGIATAVHRFRVLHHEMLTIKAITSLDSSRTISALDLSITRLRDIMQQNDGGKYIIHLLLDWAFAIVPARQANEGPAGLVDGLKFDVLPFLKRCIWLADLGCPFGVGKPSAWVLSCLVEQSYAHLGVIVHALFHLRAALTLSKRSGAPQRVSQSVVEQETDGDGWDDDGGLLNDELEPTKEGSAEYDTNYSPDEVDRDLATLLFKNESDLVRFGLEVGWEVGLDSDVFPNNDAVQRAITVKALVQLGGILSGALDDCIDMDITGLKQELDHFESLVGALEILDEYGVVETLVSSHAFVNDEGDAENDAVHGSRSKRTLRWLSISFSNTAVQRAMVHWIAQSIGSKSSGLKESAAKSSWIDGIKFLNELRRLGILSVPSTADIYSAIVGGALRSGHFKTAKDIMFPDDGFPPLPGDDVEDLLLGAAREFFENAESPDITLGNLKMAYDCLQVHPFSPAIKAEISFIEAIYHLYRMGALEQEDTHLQMLPIEVRSHKDRIQLVKKSLAGSKRYANPSNVLELCQKLGIPSSSKQPYIIIAEAALNDSDVTIATDMCFQAANLHTKPRSDGEFSEPDGLWRLAYRIAASDGSWVQIQQKDNHFTQPNLQKRIQLLQVALRTCPVEEINTVIELWRELAARRDLAVVLDEAEDRSATDGAIVSSSSPRSMSDLGLKSVVSDRFAGSLSGLFSRALEVSDRVRSNVGAAVSLLGSASELQRVAANNRQKARAEKRGGKANDELDDLSDNVAALHEFYLADSPIADGDWYEAAEKRYRFTDDEDFEDKSLADKYESKRSRMRELELSILLWRVQLGSKIRKIKQSYLDGAKEMEDDTTSDHFDLLEAAARMFSRDTILGFAHLLHVLGDERTVQFFDSIPLTPVNEQIAVYFYSLRGIYHILTGQSLSAKDLSAVIDPTNFDSSHIMSLVDELSGFIEANGNSNSEDISPADFAGKARSSILIARQHAGVVRTRRQEALVKTTLGYGVDEAAFQSDEGYRQEYLEGLLHTKSEKKLEDALAVAAQYGYPASKLLVSHFLWLLQEPSVDRNLFERRMAQYRHLVYADKLYVAITFAERHEQFATLPVSKLSAYYESLAQCFADDSVERTQLGNRLSFLLMLENKTSLSRIFISDILARNSGDYDDIEDSYLQLWESLDDGSRSTFQDLIDLVPRAIKLERLTLFPDELNIPPPNGQYRPKRIVSALYLQFLVRTFGDVEWIELDRESVEEHMQEIVAICGKLVPRHIREVSNLLIVGETAAAIPVTTRKWFVEFVVQIVEAFVPGPLVGVTVEEQQSCLGELKKMSTHLDRLAQLRALTDPNTEDRLPYSMLREFDVNGNLGEPSLPTDSNQVLLISMIEDGQSPFLVHGAASVLAMDDVVPQLYSRALRECTEMEPFVEDKFDCIVSSVASYIHLGSRASLNDGIGPKQTATEDGEGWEDDEPFDGWDDEEETDQFGKTLADIEETVRTTLLELGKNEAVDETIRMCILKLVKKFYGKVSEELSDLNSLSMNTIVKSAWGFEVDATQDKDEIFEQLISVSTNEQHANALLRLLMDWDAFEYSQPLRSLWAEYIFWCGRYSHFSILMDLRMDRRKIDIFSATVDSCLLEILKPISICEYWKHGLLSNHPDVSELVVTDLEWYLSVSLGDFDVSSDATSSPIDDEQLHILICGKGLATRFCNTSLWPRISKSLLNYKEEPGLLSVVAQELTDAGQLTSAAGSLAYRALGLGRDLWAGLSTPAALARSFLNRRDTQNVESREAIWDRIRYR